MQDRIVDIPASEQATKRKLRPFQVTMSRSMQVSFLTQAVDLNEDGEKVGDFHRADGEYDCSTVVDMGNPDDQAGVAWLNTLFDRALAQEQ